MKIKLIQTHDDTTLFVSTKLTPEMLQVVPAEDRVLKDKSGNVVFAMEFDDNACVTPRGMVMPSSSFSMPLHNTAEKAALLLAQIKDNASKLEAQIIKSYSAIVKKAEEIEVEYFGEGDEE